MEPNTLIANHANVTIAKASRVFTSIAGVFKRNQVRRPTTMQKIDEPKSENKLPSE
ncbi:MAG: hypothetical protein IGBAC_0100 [Ignavibacteriae bacterium]|nr:MAG: hypothetical protein IGBAC_0100 [Ignavibacteriota bacterium]